jgi:dihydrofolate synthase/folylpolyglutamate synthase
MRLLGETLPEIAAEKAGIIKADVPVLSGVCDEAPRAIIEATARRQGSRLFRLDGEIAVEELSSEADGLPFFAADFSTPWGGRRRLHSPLPGRHQIRNLGLAAAAFDLLSRSWRPLSDGAIERGLASLKWPLRVEQVSARPRVILDSAHNDASVRACCETLAGLSEHPRIVVFGTSRDKDMRVMVEILARAFDIAVLTRYARNPRALPTDQIEEAAAQLMPGRYVVSPDPEHALDRARALAGQDGLICVTGSLFLAAEMRSVVRGMAP